MRDIYLVRHGRPDFGDSEAYYLGGGVDNHITQASKEAAALLAEYFKDKNIENYYSSPMHRTRETLEAFLPKGKTYTVLEEAREISYGEWEGKLKSIVGSKYRESYETENAPESAFPKNYETQEHACERMLRAIGKTEGNCVLVAHGAVNNLAICKIAGIPFHKFLDIGVTYLGISKIVEDNGEYKVEFIGLEYPESRPENQEDNRKYAK